MSVEQLLRCYMEVSYGWPWLLTLGTELVAPYPVPGSSSIVTADSSTNPRRSSRLKKKQAREGVRSLDKNRLDLLRSFHSMRRQAIGQMLRSPHPHTHTHTLVGRVHISLCRSWRSSFAECMGSGQTFPASGD